jgi:hypothetical protein
MENNNYDPTPFLEKLTSEDIISEEMKNWPEYIELIKTLKSALSS